VGWKIEDDVTRQESLTESVNTPATKKYITLIVEMETGSPKQAVLHGGQDVKSVTTQHTHRTHTHTHAHTHAHTHTHTHNTPHHQHTLMRGANKLIAAAVAVA
jgi:hypothetical protein